MKFIMTLCTFSFYFPLLASPPSKISEYSVTGKIDGLPDNTKIYLIRYSKDLAADTAVTAYSQNGKFVLQSNLNYQGEINWVKIDTSVVKFPSGKNSYITLFIDNNKIGVCGNLNDWPQIKVTGSQATAAYYSIIDTILQYQELLKPSSDNEKMARMRSIYAEKVLHILKQYPDEYATAVITKNLTTALSKNDIESIYTVLTDRVKQSYHGKMLNSIIKYLGVHESIHPGNIVPSFNIKTPAGKIVDVKKYVSKNKYTLIDFWASWCKPCREEIPNLKKVYNMFRKKGFDIIGISSDQNQQEWTAALKKENMPWLQGKGDGIKIGSDIFGISSIPSYMLIDKEGKMIAFDCARGTVKSFGPDISGQNLISTLSKLFAEDGND